MRIISEGIDYDDVLLVPSRNTLESRQDVNLSRTFEFYHSPRNWTGLPIMCANVATTGTLTMSKQLRKWGIITALHKYYTSEQLNSVFQYGWNDTTGIIDYTWVTIGMKDEDIQRIRDLDNLNNSELPNIVIDVPNGHLEKFVKFCSKVRNEFPESVICAGNVANPSITQELIIHGGVDIVKVGIGCSRQLCSTRLVAGVGYPQLSCISECANVAHGLKSGEKRLGLICGDGGINHIGDFAKGFGSGADFLMSAGMFAGTDECDEAEWELEYEHINSLGGKLFWFTESDFGVFSSWRNTGKSRKKRMKYYGMSSHYAQKKHGEGEKSYRASEGEISWVDYRGQIDDIIREIRGGLASAGTYIGAGSLKDFAKCANFVKVNRIK